MSARGSDAVRAGVLVLLAGLLVWSLRADLPPSPVLLASGETTAVPVPSPGAEWRGPPPSGAQEWAQVERAAAAGPLRVWTAPAPPSVVLVPPLRLRTGRLSTLGVRLSAPPGSADEVMLRIEDPAGQEELVPLAIGSDGVARGSVPLRPRVPGWQRWRVGPARDAAGEDGAPGTEEEPVEWHGYALLPRPLRVLVVSGPPTQEVRFVLRALEERGEEVESWIHLGRELWAGRTGPLPGEPDSYLEWDLILVFPGSPLPDAAVGALLAAVEAGAGLLLVGGAGAGTPILPGTGLAAGWMGEERARADTLDWSVPPALSPLPAAGLQTELEVEFTRLAGEGHPWIRLGALGRGRVGAVGLAESWRWRMEEGMDEPHRDWWAGWASWLTDGLGSLPVLEVEGGVARAGEPLRLRWIDESPVEGGLPILLQGGGAGGEELERWLTAVPGEVGGEWHAARGAVVPRAGGGLLMDAAPRDEEGGAGGDGAGEGEADLSGEGPVAIHVLEAGAPPPDPGVRLSRLGFSSPGGEVIHLSATDPPPGPDRRRRREELLLPVFLLLAAATGTSWAIHRLREPGLREPVTG